MMNADPLKPLFWVGSALEEVRAFPVEVRRQVGFALYLAQAGGKHMDAKPLKGFGGAGVLELVEIHSDAQNNTIESGCETVLERNTMSRKSKVRKSKVRKSSGSVFADLAVPDASEALAKAEIARRIIEILDGRRLTQMAAAKMLGIDQPKISALKRGRLQGFSTERLFKFLNALDRDIEIVIKKKSSNARRARIRVS
jgi:predicted XRE-type DNA-binding protein